uniref:Bidirectional sugar transporter SWEET n=1 Tax=Globisporangium ultimum (strain ATCC 200006 / CBS 805.95 / DAOM BR144) TaxID=431595 RepID=K3WEY1_GLOUD
MTNAGLIALQAMASASSVVQCLSPLPSIYRVHKAKNTGELSVLPLASLLGVCHIWMMYGYLSGSIFPLCATYLFGDVVSVMYIIVFYRYTSERKYTFQVVASVVFVLLLVTVYVALGKLGVTDQSTNQVSSIIGFIGIGVSIILYASPLETIKRVITTKSASSIPILLCVVGTISNALWTADGLIIGDIQNEAI